MRSGIAWDELSTSFLDPSNSFVRMTQTSDWYDHVLTRPMEAAPDARFNLPFTLMRGLYSAPVARRRCLTMAALPHSSRGNREAGSGVGILIGSG